MSEQMRRCRIETKAQVLIVAAFPVCENERRLGVCGSCTRFPLTNGWGRSCRWTPPPRLRIRRFLKSVAARRAWAVASWGEEANGNPALPPAANELPLLRSHGYLEIRSRSQTSGWIQGVNPGNSSFSSPRSLGAEWEGCTAAIAISLHDSARFKRTGA